MQHCSETERKKIVIQLGRRIQLNVLVHIACVWAGWWVLLFSLALEFN